MDMDRDISRRHMLALSAAAGGLAFGGGMSRAFAQASTRIEQLAPELDKIIATSETTAAGGPPVAAEPAPPVPPVPPEPPVPPSGVDATPPTDDEPGAGGPASSPPSQADPAGKTSP